MGRGHVKNERAPAPIQDVLRLALIKHLDNDKPAESLDDCVARLVHWSDGQVTHELARKIGLLLFTFPPARRRVLHALE